MSNTRKLSKRLRAQLLEVGWQSTGHKWADEVMHLEAQLAEAVRLNEDMSVELTRVRGEREGLKAEVAQARREALEWARHVAQSPDIYQVRKRIKDRLATEKAT